MAAPEIERLIKLIGRLPGLGPRSARRAALSLMKHRESLMRPLLEVLEACRDKVAPCRRCGNLDTSDPCAVCTDPQRVKSVVCVVQEVEDLWAMERSSAYRGQFHVLGGTLSALDGRGPDNLAIGSLLARVEAGEEVVRLRLLTGGRKRPVLAPGEMETVRLKAELLRGPGDAVTVTLEEG